jgi:hypothetical protein
VNAMTRVSRGASHRGPRASLSDRIAAADVRELAARMFGRVGNGKQMAQALGVSHGNYRWAMSEGVVPSSWNARVRALQQAQEGVVTPEVRVAVQGAMAGAQPAVEALAPRIHAFAQRAEAGGWSRWDVAVALLSVGALRLVRVP